MRESIALYGLLLCRAAKWDYDDKNGGDSYKNNNNNTSKQEISRKTNPRKLQGNLADVIREAVSGKAGLLNNDMVKSMNHDAIIFALSNPDPVCLPSDVVVTATAKPTSTITTATPTTTNTAERL